MNTKLTELKNRLIEINDLASAAALLTWDQATYMPSGGAAARGRQLGTLKKMSHEKFTDPTLGDLLLALEQEKRPGDSDEAALLRVTRKEFDRATKVPTEFMARFSEHTSATYDAWHKAKEENNFKKMIPYLQKTLALSQEYAGFFKSHEHVADPLIDVNDEGMTAKTVQALFAKLRPELVALVSAIQKAPPVEASRLLGKYDVKLQRQFGERVIKRFGYDFNRGRQDKTHHPFMTKFSLGDVRITTRFREDDVTDSLFSTMHEAGHALYEQGIDQVLEGLPLANGTSAGVHESQSRLWENLVGRSKTFWQFFYPELCKMFPEPLQKIGVVDFYKMINKVEPSLIRTDADEVTYNLHVMIRFDMELALLEGKLCVEDMPAMWRERYQSDLGVTPPDDKQGVMQDVHWYTDFIGGQFQCYTIGNILSAQFFAAALKAKPEIVTEMSRGEFATLREWLRDNVHRHGRRLSASEVVQKATGSEMRIEPYRDYLKTKYGELYGL